MRQLILLLLGTLSLSCATVSLGEREFSLASGLLDSIEHEVDYHYSHDLELAKAKHDSRLELKVHQFWGAIYDLLNEANTHLYLSAAEDTHGRMDAHLACMKGTILSIINFLDLHSTPLTRSITDEFSRLPYIIKDSHECQSLKN